MFLFRLWMQSNGLESKTEVGKTSYDAVLESAGGITTLHFPALCRFQCGVAEVNRALLL